MFNTDIVINTNTYNLISQRTTSSVRSDASTGLANPNTLTISHETNKAGRVSSVIILDSEEVVACQDACSTAPTLDNIRMMMKIQYNPLSGRIGIDTELERLRVLLSTFTADAASWAKFINKES